MIHFLNVQELCPVSYEKFIQHLAGPYHQKFDPRPAIPKNREMNKILLIYDDFAELNTVDYSLKKVGFDVISISSEFLIQEKILSFNPEIVIAYARGPKVTSIGVGKRLKDMSRWGGKVLLIFPQGNKPDPQDLIRARMDLLLEAPIPVTRLIQILAKITNQDDQQLLEKLIKAAATESVEAQSQSNAQKVKSDKENFYVGGKTKSDNDTQYVVGPGEKKTSTKVDSGSFQMNPEVVAKAPGKKDQFTLAPEGESEKENASLKTDKPFLKDNEAFPEIPESLKNADPFQQMKNELESRESSFEKAKKAAIPEAATVKPLVPPELTDAKFKNELDEARNSLPNRTKKYFEFTKELKLNEESSLQRISVRREQNKLAEDWDKSTLDEQDNLRRKFTNALFKK